MGDRKSPKTTMVHRTPRSCLQTAHLSLPLLQGLLSPIMRLHPLRPIQNLSL